MSVTVNTIVKLKMSGFKPFERTEKKPAGVKLQSRYTREEGGLSQFEIKIFELTDIKAKALKGKTLQLEHCTVFRAQEDYAPSYWKTSSHPTEIKESVDRPIINTVISGKVEAIEPFSGEKMNGYTLFFIEELNNSESIISVKIANLDDVGAKQLLHKDIVVEQCKPLSKTSYITEEKAQTQKINSKE